ncbi:MAG: Peptide transport system permease protein sapC [uncultured Sphingosinicella sp.]|uniref:Peptide transport system permease protein sapC n=1 Tax=uncultured Sphingosinicella sp. TaxID=478748 RepID=A0A6J4TTL2_9SPHN|nr:SapC family protein [uncultured Sphingosinicella sp.]CAA9531267.1 MAG: Peptide transport system permease protein sapC [uncultured Sphingosinicella sp.]
MTDHAILTAEAHRDLRVRTERGADLGDAVMCSIVVPAEFRQVQNEYPILFRLNAERDSFTALAMFGFETGENLFLENGRWDARYRPLAIDIQPFLIGMPDGVGEKQVHIDMASPRVGGSEGVRLFDEDGRPTPYLETIADQLGALDAGYQTSGDFFGALRRHDLLEPLTLEVELDDGSKNRLVGFHIIDEQRLQALDAAALGELHAEDHLLHIFMAVASLANLSALIERKNRRVVHG